MTMPRSIGVDEVRTLFDRGAQLIEVLPEGEYQEEHLPGAINIPLKSLTKDAVADLDRAASTIVYCWDGA